MSRRAPLWLVLVLGSVAWVATDAQVAPPTRYDAISDRAPRAEPSLPKVGAAGSSFFDPVFASRLWRITDGATRPSASNRSYRTPSRHQNAWSADGAYFYVLSADGTIVPYAFDAITERAQRIDADSKGEGGRVLQFYNEPHFSYTIPGVIYGSFNGPGESLRTIDAYDFSQKTYERILDLDRVAHDLAGTYVGGIGSSGGEVERLIAFFGGTSQDRHRYAVVFDRRNVRNQRLVDTIASTLDGRATNIPLNFSLQHAFIDRSGRFVMLHPAASDCRAPRSAAPAYLWDVEGGSFAELKRVAVGPDGHHAFGYGVIVNLDCCTTSTRGAAQWQLRSLRSPLAPRELMAPVVDAGSAILADHPSWHNARPAMSTPFIIALSRYGGNQVPWRAWDDEIVAIETAAEGKAATVWRLAHHRSDVTNDDDPSRAYFWYMPRPSVSPDGRWVLFTSNWEKQLGTDPGGQSGGRHRQDVFLLKLRAVDGEDAAETGQLLVLPQAIGKTVPEVRAAAPVDAIDFNPRTTPELQAILDTAPPGSTILLEPGVTYRSVRIRPLAGRTPSSDRQLTVTTRGFSIGSRVVMPADAPRMATIKGDDGTSFGMWVQASGVTIRGLRFAHIDPGGQGDMLRLGDSTDPNPVNVPGEIRILQSLFEGRTDGEELRTTRYGQKRAIAANSKDSVIDQIWCHNIWIAGQDSQCVAVFSTPGRITVRRSVLSAASENMLIGGVPPASPAHFPEDIVLEDSLLYKPLKWKGASPARVVKNLYEIKFGRRIVARRNFMINNWVEAQTGYGVVLTMDTNGACSFCEGRDWIFEDNVVWNSAAGLNLTGWQYSHAPGAGQAIGFYIRNNVFFLDRTFGQGRGDALFVSNEPRDVVLERNTFIHNSNSFVMADYGTKWPYQEPPLRGAIAAGPLRGFKYLSNIVGHRDFGIFVPAGTQGTQVTTYFPDIEIRGNILGGAPAPALARYNATGSSNEPNVAPAMADVLAALDANYCPKPGGLAEGKGADCSRLKSVFALRSLLSSQELTPEPRGRNWRHGSP